jgi:small subunit ribosomal protein S5
MSRIEADTLDLEEHVLRTNKVNKTHKGGRTLSWSVIVAVGDRKGHVGTGMGKARAIPDAVRKAVERAKKNIMKVPLAGTSIPHEVQASAGAAKVMLKPAAPGCGVVAGGAVRPILELAGIRDVLAKSLGSANAVNCAWATIRCLKSLKRADETAALRGKRVGDIVPWLVRLREEDLPAMSVDELTEDTEELVEAAAEPLGDAE